MKKNFDKFTVIIPEHNRPEHLKRLLSYYLSFGVKVIVADSSDKELSYISEYKNKIEYVHTPRKPLAEKIHEISNLIRTPYVFMCANDDFVIPDTVNKIVDFLDKNPLYNSGQGIYFDFSYKNDHIEKSLLYSHIIGKDLSEDCACKRVLNLMSNYFQYYYCVYRTDIFQQTYQSVINKDGKALIHNLNLLELYISIYPLIDGNHIVLSSLYAARESILGSASSYVDNIGEVISQKKYHLEYQNFMVLLSTHLSQKENIAYINAQRIIERAIITYMDNSLPKYFSFKLPKYFSIKSRFLRAVKAGLKKINLFKNTRIVIKIKKRTFIQDDSFVFSLQDLDNWEKIQEFIMQYAYIYKF